MYDIIQMKCNTGGRACECETDREQENDQKKKKNLMLIELLNVN